MLIKLTATKAVNLANVDCIDIEANVIRFGLAAQSTVIKHSCASAQNAQLALGYIFDCAENGNTAVDISNY